MGKPKVISSKTGDVAWGPFNSLPGPTKKTTVTYDNGKSKTGYGYSKSESDRNARKK